MDLNVVLHIFESSQSDNDNIIVPVNNHDNFQIRGYFVRQLSRSKMNNMDGLSWQ